MPSSVARSVVGSWCGAAARMLSLSMKLAGNGGVEEQAEKQLILGKSVHDGGRAGATIVSC
jgi:hypothetical protein